MSPNSIRRPRAHPRRKSVNFRTLWWIAAREAALELLAPAWQTPGWRLPGSYARWFLRGRSTYDVARMVRRIGRPAAGCTSPE